jgi:galactose-1-phosphate uridylyltransferase
MVGQKHGRTLDDFPSSLLFDAFSASLEFIRRCFESDPDALFFTINANFMPPAGGSIMHPHFQIMGSPFPMTHHRLLLERSLAYHRDIGSCYWLDRVVTERESGQRWLGEIAPSQWFTAFSPIGANEVNAVWPHTSHFLEWGDEDIQAMAEGVRRVFLTYHDLMFSTFKTCISITAQTIFIFRSCLKTRSLSTRPRSWPRSSKTGRQGRSWLHGVNDVDSN